MNKITILGSGDALGTPAIGCKRPASIDAKVNPKSRRTRFGMFIQLGGVNILIDPNPDIKQQLIDNDIRLKDIDHIFTTHQHSDHVNGLGEFFYRREEVTKLWYGKHPLNEKLVDYWRYLEREGVMSFNEFEDYSSIKLSKDVQITPVAMSHGFPASGFVVESSNAKIGIVTDSNNSLSKETIEALVNCDYLFVDSFSENLDQVKGVYEDCNIAVPDLEEEWFHMTLPEVKELQDKTKSDKTFTVHMSRHMAPHDKLVTEYQTDKFIIGYDGLSVNI